MSERNHKSGSALLPIKQYRRLKVREAYYSYQLSQHHQQRNPIGEIQLKGQWLIQAGFDIDTSVTVRVMERCLVLTTEQSG